MTYLNSAASEALSSLLQVSVKMTRHRGSPPHRSSKAFERPQDSDASVANTTWGETGRGRVCEGLVGGFTGGEGDRVG